MRMKKSKMTLLVGALVVASIIGIVSMSGCIDEKTVETPKQVPVPTPTETSKPEVTPVKEEAYKTVTDMRGKAVRIPKDPKRVVAISEGMVDQIMVAFGIEDKIVGYGSCGKIRDCDTSGYLAINDTSDTYNGSWYIGSILYPKMRELPYLGTPTKGINYEQLAELNPDIIIMRARDYDKNEGEKKTIATIEKLGFPLIIINRPNHYDKPDVSTIYKEIEVLGEIFDKQEKAEELIDFLDGKLTFIKERTKNIPESEKPGVLYFGLSRSARKKGGAGNVRGIDSIQSIFLEDIINAKNAYRGKGRVIMSAEQILALNPDVIVLPTSSGFHPPRELYEAEAFENIREVKAIKEKRACSLPAVGCRSERLDFAMTLMIEAKCVYPERFKDIDLNEFVDNYYKDVFDVSDDKVEKLKLTQRLRWLEIIE